MEPEIENILKELLDAAGIPYTKIARSELAGQVIFSIETSDNGRELLGNHADTVHALDHLVKKIAETRLPPRDAAIIPDTNHDHLMFLVDVNDHRATRSVTFKPKRL